MTETHIAAPAVGVRWDLSELFAGPDDPTWSAAIESALSEARAFAARYRGTIDTPGGPAASHLRDALVAYEGIHDRSSRAGAFARLMYAADTLTPVVREIVARADAFATELRNLLLFFDLEWLEVSEGDAVRLMADPVLANYAEYLRRERLFLPHKLTEAEEKIVNEKDLSGRRAWTKLFAEVTSSLTFPLPDGDGTRPATLSEVLSRVHDPRREVRKEAHDILFDVLGKSSQVLTFLFDTLVQDHQTMDRLRKLPDPMRERHLTNNVPPEAVDGMMAVVEENYDIAHRYWRAKARMIGLERLTVYDQYAPIGGAREETSFQECRSLVLTSFDGFDPSFRGMAEPFFERRWIDAEVRPGKRGGAFCAYPSPSIHPYILTNYTGNRRDVMTVAHELGHGIHGILARDQTLLNFHSPLPLAETASVFAEMLVFDHLMSMERDPVARRALTAGQIESVFATVFRQNVLTRFESAVFEARARARLTTERIGDLWIEANRPYYGDALELTEGYRLGWSYIPHFINTRFYCYAYTFGELLVLALYALYRERGPAFVPQYVALLRNGGLLSPVDAIRTLGMDIREPDFWRRGFGEIRRLVETLDADGNM